MRKTKIPYHYNKVKRDAGSFKNQKPKKSPRVFISSSILQHILLLKNSNLLINSVFLFIIHNFSNQLNITKFFQILTKFNINDYSNKTELQRYELFNKIFKLVIRIEWVSIIEL